MNLGLALPRGLATGLALLLLAAPGARADQPVAAVAVDGTAFRITLADGRVLSGPGLVGATLALADGKGGQLAPRIDAVESDPRDPAGEIALYAFSVADPAASGGRRSLCDPRGIAFGIWLTNTLWLAGWVRMDSTGGVGNATGGGRSGRVCQLL